MTVTEHEVILVTQEGCNPCLRVQRLLAGLRAEIGGVVVREVTLDSTEGQELALHHNILFPPAVFVDGHLLAKGKIHEHDLRSALTSPTLAVG